MPDTRQKTLFEVRDYDRKFYGENICDFLPERIIDMHTHVWRNRDKAAVRQAPVRSVTWPRRVAEENPVEDLMETYRLMFPDKKVLPLLFTSATRDDDLDVMNAYVREAAGKINAPALLYAAPWWSAEELERKIRDGGFFGIKVYLNLSEPYIPADEIRIFDFLPPHQLAVMNRLHLLVMLHIPRKARLKDPVNLAQILEIEEKYPDLKLILAHVGRAYCPEDIGDAFSVLGRTRNLVFDISANCCQGTFEKLIEAVGPKRILFGSDLPILRMRSKRICENGIYVNLVPRGLYGDVSGDKNMREVDGAETDQYTFFMYEEIEAFRQAALKTGLTRKDIEGIFYGNAVRLLEAVGYNLRTQA